VSVAPTSPKQGVAREKATDAALAFAERSPEITSTRTITWQDPMPLARAAREMSGLEFLRAQITGELTPPPIHHLTGIRLVDVDQGRATHVLPCSPWLSTGFRTVQGGFTAMLAELSLAGAAFSTVEPGVAIAPLDLKINFLRPVLPDMRDLTAEAEVIHRGRSIAITSCRVTNADGKPVALATGSSMYLPGRPASLIGVEQLGSSDAEEAGA